MTATAGQRSYTPVSFRDPDGVLDVQDDRVFRVVMPHAEASFADVLARPVIAGLMQSGRLVATRSIDAASLPPHLQQCQGAAYEHERIPFVSYPCEWSPAMLLRAAECTLEIAGALHRDGLMLKDATPANILFRGAEPVFVDLLSIVPRPKGHFLWLARQQFEACFLLPLIASIEAGIPLAWSLQNPVGGIAHEQVARILGARRWLKPALISGVALPAAMTGASAGTAGRNSARQLSNEEQARYTFGRTLSQLVKRVSRLASRVRTDRSRWQAYTQARNHYGDDDLAQKRAFVADSLVQLRPQWVLDIGANTGEFSAMAAAGAHVVAVDVDEESAGQIFQRAGAERLDIQPLVGNFARPTPGLGWRGAEMRSFIERTRQRFDLVLMLAVVHHLRVTEGVPIAAILDLAAEITRSHLLIEYVPPTDPMFQSLARGRESLYGDCVREQFEQLLGLRFRMEKTLVLPNARVLYLVSAKAAHPG